MLRRSVRLLATPFSALARAQLTKELTPALTHACPVDQYCFIRDRFQELDSKDIAALERSAIEAGFACTADQVADVVPVLHDADVAKVATTEFRDRVFTRLANAPEVTADAMPILFHTLYHFARKTDRDVNVFSEPEFVLGFCVRAVAVAAPCDPGAAPCRTVWWAFHMLWTATTPSCTNRSWSVPLARAARDTFFVPAAACFARHHAAIPDANTSATAMQCLDNITGMSPEIAALFCTAEFRDQFFIALFRTGAYMRDSRFFDEYASNALLHIATAAPTRQRQEVFATPEFRDEVIVPLLWTAGGFWSDGDIRETCEKAVIAIAENEDGTVHPTFADESSKNNTRILAVLRRRQGSAIKST